MRKALMDIAMRFANVAPAALEAKSSHSPLRRPSVKSGCSSSMTACTLYAYIRLPPGTCQHAQTCLTILYYSMMYVVLCKNMPHRFL